MNKKHNILYISPNFNLACGVSKHVFTLLTSEALRKEFNLYFLTNGGDALHKLENDGVNYSLFNFKTDKLFHLDIINNLKQLKNFCKENQINIIHSHHRFPEFLSNRIKKSMGIKTVITVHNFVTGFKQISYKSDFIIAISNSVKDHLMNYFGIESGKIKVMYNCVEKAGDNVTNENKKYFLDDVPQDHFLLLYAGRIVEEKGIETLIKSFKKLTGSEKKIFLIIVGDDSLSKRKKSLPIESNKIVVLPAQEELHEYYKAANTVILPSLNEGLGYSILEAGMYKVPFIGSRTGGIAEFIEDGINGYLFKPGSSDDLASKIEYVLTHVKEARLSAEKLHQKVLKECSCKQYFEKLVNTYYNMLSEE